MSKKVLYVIRKRWSSRFRCTVWRNRILEFREKRVICSLWRHHFLSINFMRLDRYISHNKYFFMVNDDLSWRTKEDNAGNIHWVPIKKGPGCGPSSAQKKQPTFLQIKHDYPYIFQKIVLFSLHHVNRELSCRSRYSFMDMFSKETRIAASMNEAGSMPKGMKWSVVCVFKVFLTIYLRQAVRRM